MPTPAEYQKMIEGGCPYCGEALVIRNGRYGEFIACQEYCGYTNSIPGRSTPRITNKNTCKKCAGTGLIPFVKDGKVVPNAYLHCSCHPFYSDNPEPERYWEVKPDDYDYPLSGIFRGASFELCGVADPGYVPPEPEKPEPQVQVIEHRHSDMSKKDFASLRNLEGQVKYLQGKVMEREKRKPGKPSGYKGIK